MESLAERILFSDGGSFLVTGYRGVGKTSYVNQVITKLEEALPWAQTFLGKIELVDVYLNVARPVQPSEIMHHIIRQLHDRLIEKGLYRLLDNDLQEALTLAYHRTSLNMARKLAESSERNFGFNEASIGADWMKAAIKMSVSSKRSRTQNYEISYLGYDDKAAEHDIISICRRLVMGYSVPQRKWERVRSIFNRVKPLRVRLKIVFVFDELDKLEEFTEGSPNGQKPVIDQILGTLKNLFTTSGVTFVFVAGKDLQERWLEDVGKGDSVYESVFSYDRYLPCLWTDVDSICDSLVDNGALASRQIYVEFKEYLAYKGRGIPRRIVRTFNEYVEWLDDRPVLTFTPQAFRRIRFFAALQRLLRTHEKQLFGHAHEEVVGTQSDKRRLGVYYLIDWILRRGSSEFTRADVLSASKSLSAKIALAEEIAPNAAQEILKVLISGEYIEEVRKTITRVLVGDPNSGHSDADKRYRLVPRRLVEFGGVVADTEVDSGLDLSPSTEIGQHPEVSKIGKYRVVRRIAEGGMGVVYEAVDEYGGRKVAIKMLLHQLGELTARFEREAMIMGELDHPNIVRLYDWDKENGRVYIVMEYLDGPTLDDVLRTHGRLSLEFAVAIINPVLEAVRYLHEKGFVRNDIKPHNIKLTSAGRVCLLDFGITRPTKSKVELLAKFETTAGVLIGTPIVMAPEQFDYTADERSDIYSLGIVFYRMLTGKYPFEERLSIGELLGAKLNKAPTPPSEYVQLSPELDELILRCLKKDPIERFQSVRELINELANRTRYIPAYDLKFVLSEVRKSAREVEQIDRMQTLAPAVSSFALPMSTPSFPSAASSMERSLPAVSDTLSGWASSAGDRFPVPDVTMQTIPEITLNSYLILLEGTQAKMELQLPVVGSGYRLQKKTTFGRSSDNVIVLREPKVSRFHGQIDLEDDNWFVEDFNSFVGTYINGQRIAGRRLLNDGDNITIGDFVFKFRYGSQS